MPNISLEQTGDEEESGEKVVRWGGWGEYLSVRNTPVIQLKTFRQIVLIEITIGKKENI